MPVKRAGLLDAEHGHTLVGWQKSDRLFQEWITRIEERSAGQAFWFRAREPNKNHPGTHFHGLIGGVGNLRRDQAHREWFEANGQARIEPLERWHSKNAISLYVSKYVTKTNGEWVMSPNAGAMRRSEVK